MRFIDEKGRIFGKINIFDIFLVLLLVLIIGGFSLQQNNLQTKLAIQAKAKEKIEKWIEKSEEELAIKRKELDAWIDGYKEGYKIRR